VGTPIADVNQPIEILRVVHSFDPCMACSVHLSKPNGQVKRVSDRFAG
jgi:hydrogenase large subunit